MLWWNGAGEEVPDAETKIDVAYSLRANTYRGQKQLTLQFQELRVGKEKLIEVRKSKLEIRDLRLQPSFINLPPSCLIWAEGNDKAQGKSRFDLHQADEFAIYTTPPSPAELRAALEVVKPKTIYLLGVSPTQEKTDEFLSRISGMAKFVINQRGGKVSIKELAVATAQREATIRMGLEWLGAGGHIKVRDEADEITLSEGDGIPNSYLQRELYTAVKGLLEETVAYRNYFSRAETKSLFKF